MQYINKKTKGKVDEMKSIRIICALLLCFSLLLTGCKDSTTKKKVVVVRRNNSSQSETDSSTEGEDTSLNESQDIEFNDYVESEEQRAKRALAVKETVTTEEYQPEYELKEVTWAGPEEYVIIYPKGNVQLKKAAEKLKEYYESYVDSTIEVLDDTTPKKTNEILIGDTSRTKSSLAENKYAVSLNKNTVVFESGNLSGV